MKRISLAVAAIALSACASTPPKPPTPAELLTAAPWTCESKIGPGTLNSTQTYKKDGTAAVDLTIVGEGQGMKVNAAGAATATWKLLENDTKMEVTLGGLTISRANLNGANIDPALAQSMIAPYIAGQSAVTAIAITSTTLELTGEDAKTSCTRAPKA
jgi:hypothetical protein